MKPFLFSLLLQGIALSACAQSVPDPITYKWVPQDMVRLNDSVTVFTTRQGQVAAIDRYGRETGPEIQVPGDAVGIGLLGDSLLMLYTKERRHKAFELHSLRVDIAQGKAGEDKLLLTLPAEYLSDYDVQKDAAGHLRGVLARVTKYEIDGDPTTAPPTLELGRIQFGSSSQASEVIFGTGRELRVSALSGHILQNRFIGAQLDSAGDLFVETYDGRQVLVEKENAAGAVISSLTAVCTPRKNGEVKAMAALDPLNENAVTLDAFYESSDKDYWQSAYRFDFGAGKTWIAPIDTVDDRYFARLGQNPLAWPQPLLAMGRMHGNGLIPVSIEETPDRIILCKELEFISAQFNQGTFHSSSTVIHHYGSSVVTILDKQMNTVHQVYLRKDFTSSYFFDPATGTHLDGDTLYIVTNESNGEYAYALDVETGIYKRKKIRKETALQTASIKPRFVVWSKDGLLANYVFDHTVFKTDDRTTFNQVEYEQ
jgi:hypothetical protein